jgi:hypothetical protein
MKAVMGLMGAALVLAPVVQAAEAPTVVEMFTSKYCPNCPAAEHKMKEVAAQDPNLLVVFEHVDYWDQGDRKDPLGLAEVTQRQYDYSNTLGRRPGEVFTPMPLIDGRVVTPPPLWLNWSDGLKQARSTPTKALLEVAKKANGDMVVQVPATVAVKDAEMWLIGMDPLENTPIWTARGITQADMNASTVTIAKPMVPAGKRVLVLLQKAGPGAVLAMGMSK